MKLTQYQRIVQAAALGRGIRLSYSECYELTGDDAITTLAANDCDDQGIDAQALSLHGKIRLLPTHPDTTEENENHE